MCDRASSLYCCSAWPWPNRMYKQVAICTPSCRCCSPWPWPEQSAMFELSASNIWRSHVCCASYRGFIFHFTHAVLNISFNTCLGAGYISVDGYKTDRHWSKDRECTTHARQKQGYRDFFQHRKSNDSGLIKTNIESSKHLLIPDWLILCKV